MKIYNLRLWVIPSLLLMLVLSSCGSLKSNEPPHEYVDLGLSVNWATCNIGASKPIDSGYYLTFAKDWTLNTKNPDLHNGISGTNMDQATRMWGEGWRTPTEWEIGELVRKCKWKAIKSSEASDGIDDRYTSINTIGYEITGPNGNTIIIPAAGYNAHYEDGKIQVGNIWHCMLWTANPVKYLDLGVTPSKTQGLGYIIQGVSPKSTLPIRPVIDK